MKNFKIKNLNVSNFTPPILIAEIGINHGGDLKIAKNMAKLAVSNGANIIKHQTHIIEDEMSIEASSCKTGYLDETIYDTMKKNCLTLEEEKEFKIFVENELHSIYLSTPFSRKAADFLMEIDVPCFKIGSGECNNIPLLKHIASFGKANNIEYRNE